MSVATGARLGPYEVISPLGAGGMGEVYRAKDTRLDRIVAIKVLLEHLSNNPDLNARFEREARAISQLTHPHICTLYDVGHQDGIDYLVMEYLEGETLAARLAKGALPIEQVLRYGVEIAAALDKAHRGGVVHRDLKPGNIMLTRTGAKLLDFGLAKGLPAATPVPTTLTITNPITSAGAIVGTFQYMSPEQLEGKDADARTDLFAFGAVLYEMVTGNRAFEGKTQASLLSSIMTGQPTPIMQLQPTTPPPLDRLVRACLVKDRDDRIQTAYDVMLQLQWIIEGQTQNEFTPRKPAQKINRSVWMAACVILLATGAGLLTQVLNREAKKPARIWATIPAPVGATLVASGDAAGPVAISPDGRTLAFVAAGPEGQRLWVRRLDAPAARALPGTEGASFPFWSPDSRSIAYFANEKLSTISADGGAVSTICSAQAGRGGAWSPDGTIIFAPQFRSAIFRVPANGGKPEPITRLDEARHTSHRWPMLCPDGKHFLFLGVMHGVTQADSNALYLGSLDGGEPRLVMNSSANAVMVGDRLLFLRESALVAARFDVGAARIVGDQKVVATGVMCDVAVWRAAFSVSEMGILAFHTGTASHELQLRRVDRSGKELGKIGEPWSFESLRLSPDGKRIAAAVTQAQAVGPSTDIWVYEVNRGAKTRITFGGSANVSPRWAADSQSLVYASVYFTRQDLMQRVCRRPAIGGDEEVLLSSPEKFWVSDWSSDGKYLLLSRGDYLGGNKSDLWVLPLVGERKPYPLLTSPFVEDRARFSPDRKWIAYESDESGRREVYVIAFHPPEAGTPPSQLARSGKWQVSTEGGTYMAWRGDGKEIFYTSPIGKLMVVAVPYTAAGLEIGMPRELFATDSVAGIDPFDAAADGNSFVLTSSTLRQSTSIDLITNWDAELANP